MTENRQFLNCIIITMIVTTTHDSAIRWGGRRRLGECSPGGSRSLPGPRNRDRRVSAPSRADTTTRAPPSDRGATTSCLVLVKIEPENAGSACADQALENELSALREKGLEVRLGGRDLSAVAAVRVRPSPPAASARPHPIGKPSRRSSRRRWSLRRTRAEADGWEAGI
jgi:hypothetical protein